MVRNALIKAALEFIIQSYLEQREYGDCADTVLMRHAENIINDAIGLGLIVMKDGIPAYKE
jgi:hypothetical protein